MTYNALKRAAVEGLVDRRVRVDPPDSGELLHIKALELFIIADNHEPGQRGAPR
jgi:hypothetical protein